MRRLAPTNKFSGTKNDTSKIYVCQKPVIKNIRFESLGDWTMRFGVYKGWFENISLKTTDVIGGNGFSYCTFKNIRAEFSQKVIEMAMYSHNSTVDGLTATWWDGAVDPAMKPLLKMGENQRDCSYSNLTINSGRENILECAYGLSMPLIIKYPTAIFNVLLLLRTALNFLPAVMIQELQVMKFQTTHLFLGIATITLKWRIHTAMQV